MLAAWCARNNCRFTGFVFPNIFGPFGNPYYNSFIATFSYQFTRNETPKIEADAIIPLLYINDAIKIIINSIKEKTFANEIRIGHTCE